MTTDDVEDWRAFRRVMQKAEYVERVEIENDHLRLARDTLREECARLEVWIAELERRLDIRERS